MNYGLNIAASGVLTSLYRQDVMANNLANVDTVGFKPDITAIRQRDAARTEDGLQFLPSNAMLERLGAGVLAAPNRVSLTQGSIQETGRALDLAIEGNGFFMVSEGAGGNAERYRLTRDGRMALNPKGQLVLASEGLTVLDTNERPITLSGTGVLTVDPDGTLREGGEAVARLQIVEVAGRDTLGKVGAGLFRPSAGEIASRRAASGVVRQHAVERSAVDPINAMMGVTNASNAVGSNARMIQLFDELMNRAINTFGRVA